MWWRALHNIENDMRRFNKGMPIVPKCPHKFLCLSVPPNTLQILLLEVFALHPKAYPNFTMVTSVVQLSSFWTNLQIST
jgi:hypothetical protein